MLFDATRRELRAAERNPQTAVLWQLARRLGRRLTWGIADQAVSSLTNFAVVIYVARAVGAAQFGAFSLAYVTYHFALNGSRGLATDPLMTRFSGAEPRTWRRAVADCTGTALVVGVATGLCVLGAAAFMGGTLRAAFLALGLTLPGLLLQDSWRYAFFAVGRGGQAFLNDVIWAAVLLPALILLRHTGHGVVFWFVFAWGASASVAALAGPLQAKVIPRLTGIKRWLSRHRDLGFRYLAEGISQSASVQLRSTGVGLLLGLAAVGYVQASSTLMGPFQVIFFGISLVTVPEAARVLRRSPRHLPLFCLAVGGVLSAAALLWGIVLMVALPRGLGAWLLGPIWRPSYPLVLPQTLAIVGGSISVGAGAGLHALGAARRSLKAQLVASAMYLTFGLAGAAIAGAVGTVAGTALSATLGSVAVWWQLRKAVREAAEVPAGHRFWSGKPHGRHRKPVEPRQSAVSGGRRDRGLPRPAADERHY